MAKKRITSKPGAFGYVYHYDESGKYIGKSRPSIIGGGKVHYDANGKQVGTSRPGFFAKEVYHDQEEERYISSYEGLAGDVYFEDGKVVGTSRPGFFGTEYISLDVDDEDTIKESGVSMLNQEFYAVSIAAIDGMEGHEFEYFCADLLRKVGFVEVTVTPGSGDQGVDILAVKDGIRYAIQCKNYSSALGNTSVQEVSAGRQFYGCHVGVVMTNSTFTHGAIQLAAATNVLLWDRNKLEELISNAGGLGTCSEDDVDYDDFDENENYHKIIENSHPRKGMRTWSKICLGWSALCFIIFLGSIIAREREMMAIGLGEGFFVLVLGIMLKILASSEKGNLYVVLFGKRIKKSSFIAMCIAAAFVLFGCCFGITG